MSGCRYAGPMNMNMRYAAPMVQIEPFEIVVDKIKEETTIDYCTRRLEELRGDLNELEARRSVILEEVEVVEKMIKIINKKTINTK